MASCGDGCCDRPLARPGAGTELGCSVWPAQADLPAAHPVGGGEGAWPGCEDPQRSHRGWLRGLVPDGTWRSSLWADSARPTTRGQLWRAGAATPLGGRGGRGRAGEGRHFLKLPQPAPSRGSVPAATQHPPSSGSPAHSPLTPGDRKWTKYPGVPRRRFHWSDCSPPSDYTLVNRARWVNPTETAQV